jgi:hypothetical protein
VGLEMKEMKIPKSIVRKIVKDFFPEWKTWEDWKFFYGFPLWVPEHLRNDSQGACIRKTKTIYVKPYDAKRYRGHSTAVTYLFMADLIHEICHATTRGVHGKQFFQKLVACKDKAKALGYEMLANAIMIDEIEQRNSKKAGSFQVKLRRKVR